MSEVYIMKEFVQWITAGGPFGIVVLCVLIGTAGTLISLIVNQIGSYATHRADLQLKRELVERGLSVEEIERIVSAKPLTEAQPERGPSVLADARVGRS
jgi:hypothetical protein